MSVLNRLDKKQLTAFIPGTIIDVKVKVGQQVKQGETLVILDAMKMHNRILSQFNTTVKEINVKSGDRVHKGFVMVVLD
ncbi:MAG: acetyl-CoA carboxylase biotin carboxyl carrier protein subunit [Bacteroidales bacterium]|nr:MAG: acetyl-CoA carboxylase biotin carboxyl carrier protein subunit [Bacteroidales bacterium]